MYGIFYVSDNIVFLIWNIKLFLWNTLDGIIDPLLTVIIGDLPDPASHKGPYFLLLICCRKTVRT